MSQLLPRKRPVDRPDDGPRVVGLDDRESGDVFSVLSSEVARSILTELYRDPTTQSDLADRVDTSIQNVRYHLDRLADAGLVEVVDQWYSEKGTEMDVYAPNGGPLVLVAGDREQQGGPTETNDPRRACATAKRGE
jgi:DNA-binding transcriptional ArsR family regulator